MHVRRYLPSSWRRLGLQQSRADSSGDSSGHGMLRSGSLHSSPPSSSGEYSSVHLYWKSAMALSTHKPCA
ncbi:hypothetical protein D3C78_796190 [compost metagenome]